MVFFSWESRGNLNMAIFQLLRSVRPKCGGVGALPVAGSECVAE
jgi:hypothetical protein